MAEECRDVVRHGVIAPQSSNYSSPTYGSASMTPPPLTVGPSSTVDCLRPGRSLRETRRCRTTAWHGARDDRGRRRARRRCCGHPRWAPIPCLVSRRRCRVWRGICSRTLHRPARRCLPGDSRRSRRRGSRLAARCSAGSAASVPPRRSGTDQSCESLNSGSWQLATVIVESASHRRVGLTIPLPRDRQRLDSRSVVADEGQAAGFGTQHKLRAVGRGQELGAEPACELFYRIGQLVVTGKVDPHE